MIAFTHANSGGKRTDLYVMNADGTNGRNLTATFGVSNLYVAQPAWSPDGHTIMFIPFALGPVLAFINPDGTNAKSVRPFGTDTVGEPAWSPDGKWIAVETQQTLWVLRFFGRGARRVAFDGDNHDPDWQPLP